ncbi:transposase-like protein [Rhizobium lusitanum]|uniref:Transposase-like protein n=1 Tax=Rhizobium lusitanum TaxID=293958 RepID=A0A7X0IUY3_9HYPH|nr:transposase-like protein [Rhizobium lusitanum]
MERSIAVSHEAIRCWAKKFGPNYAGRLRRKAPGPNDVWYLDEVVVTLGERKHWLWRAVD